MTNSLKLISLLAASAAGLLAACSSGGGSSGTGTLGVSLTDAPACGYDKVNVTVNRVRVHQSASAGENDAGWTDIVLSPARKINLLDLTNGALMELGQTPLAAGRYTQVRLVLEPTVGNSLANSIVLSNDPANEISLKTPSATQSGLKLNSTFDVADGQRVDLVLDFDACKSIVQTGNGTPGYLLKPVVKVIPTTLNGINGYIDPALAGANVTVSAQRNGEIIRSTTPNTTTNEFFLARLEPGNYDVVITANGRATAVIAGVPVTSTTSVVPVSNTAMPTMLASSPVGSISGTALLTPASDTETVTITAKQSFAGGPTVTVAYKGANFDTGAYSLANLATAAPQLGQYSSILPIALQTKSDTSPGTGKYKIEAAATGYAAQAQPSVDATTNPANVNFTLSR